MVGQLVCTTENESQIVYTSSAGPTMSYTDYNLQLDYFRCDLFCEEYPVNHGFSQYKPLRESAVTSLTQNPPSLSQHQCHLAKPDATAHRGLFYREPLEP